MVVSKLAVKVTVLYNNEDYVQCMNEDGISPGDNHTIALRDRLETLMVECISVCLLLTRMGAFE